MMRPSFLALMAMLAVTLVTTTCQAQDKQQEATPEEAKIATLTLSSTAFGHQEAIPEPYTCEGKDLSPPLAWSGIPEGTKSLVLLVDDPDAPDPAAPKMVWVHWVLFDMPPTTSALAEGVAPDELPAGTKQGLTSWKKTGYGGPCPPIGTHRYFFRLYALDTTLALDSPDKDAVEAAMEGHVIGKGELVGTYVKKANAK